MKTNQLISLLTITLLLMGLVVPYSCSTANQGTAASKSTVEEPKKERIYATLLDRLREEPLLTISGTGNNALVLIRGNTSITGNNEPLFVVNGTPVGTGFTSVSSSIDVNNVSSIRVLSRAQSGLYGSRGGNGVIVITTK